MSWPRPSIRKSAATTACTHCSWTSCSRRESSPLPPGRRIACRTATHRGAPTSVERRRARRRITDTAGDTEAEGFGGTMSGHSKWATTKHQKAAKDAKRGKLFAKLIKNIEVAARTGGGDPDGNPTLFDAIQKAKKSSVPNDNIDRAVKRGSGAEAGGVDYQSITYEGYGPNGVAIMIECLTDNRNRAATDVRVAVTRNGGSMADPGSVSYLFSRKGVVIVPREGDVTEDDLMLAVLDAGADEINDLGDVFEVVSEPGDLVAVRTAVTDAGIEYDSADPTFIASVNVPLDIDGARTVIKLVDAIEDLDDVQNVYTNADISDEINEQLENE